MDRREFLQGAAAAAVAVSLPSSPAGAADQSEPGSEPGWWLTEPIRWLQTNLRETDAALNPSKFITDVANFHANVLMMSAGGITALYPSNVQYEYVSPYLPKGQDTFGEVLTEAHSRGIRVVSRWDFSKARKEVYDAHPEWFFKRTNGQPVIYNGLYQACINGGWYRQKSIEILTEALGRYDVDGCFFNMFSNPATDYSYHPLGLCHCDNCERLYRERFHRGIPEAEDADYRAFLHDAGVSMSITIRDLVKSKRPRAALVGTAPEIGDVAYGEANTAVHRPLPLWPCTASDNTNRWRNSYPDKGVVCQGMSFVDFPWRFATVPQPEVRTRIWQDVANGGAAAFNLHGTIAEQQDRLAIDVAIPAYAWLKDHQEYFVGQTSEARVFLLAPRSGGVGFSTSQDAYRGIFRLLTEQHIPFAAVENLHWLGKREVDLVITTGETPKALEAYVRAGGRLIVASATEPSFEIAPSVRLWKDPDGAYFRIRKKAMFPSLKETDVVFMYGDYLQVSAEGESPLTFIPPSMYGPPEFVHVDWKDTPDPGLVLKSIGIGKVAWFPWDIGGLYYRHSSQAHSGLMSDLIDNLLPSGRQLKTNAHPLVEITFMRQNGRRLVQLINLSGHSDTAYFDPVRMTGIQVMVKGRFQSARAVRSGQNLAVREENGYSGFTLPGLEEYELIDLRERS
ncbi:MAG TPA: hypothetical protein VGR96_10845 [Acidobacteriaceae bacterium]|nr:hypothetical protein [Acidobacteriaceae bacterium]